MKFIFFLIPIFLVGIISTANAETITGYNYFDTTNPDGTHSWSTHEPYILHNGEYVPFVYSNSEVETVGGKVKLETDGTYTWNSKFTDKIVAKYADVSDLNSWTYLNSLNNDTPDISWDGSQFVSTKQSAAGKLEYKYILIDGKWKTQLEATNLSALTTKAFGFDQIIDLNSDKIMFNGIERNLDNFDGTTFSKDWLVANKGKIIDLLVGVNFDFDLGFENLHSITIYDTGVNKSRLVFDYRTSTPLLPNETLVIDPTFGYTAGVWKRYFSDLTGAISNCATEVAVAGSDFNNQGILRSDDAGGRCQGYTFQNDISSLPTSIIVSSANIRIDVSAVSLPTGCDVYQVTNNPNTASDATIWADMFNGTQYVSDSTECNSTGNNKIIPLSSQAYADLRTLRLLSTQNFTFSMVEGNWDAVSGTNETTLNLATGSVDLEIVYVVGARPDAVTDLTTTSIGSNNIDIDWTAPSAGGGGQQIIGYQINVTTPWTGSPLVFLNDTGTTDTAYSITGLVFGTDYSIRVSAWGNNTGGHPFNNVTGNIVNATTTTTSYSNPPVLTVFANRTSTDVLNLQFPDSTMQNINGYRIQRETPIGTGWVTLVSNTTNTLTYYNNTGLTTNVIYNYRVYALNGSGVSSSSNEYDMTTYHLPNAVTDLTGNPTELSTIDLSWSAPASYAPEITGYMINGTTPEGEPVDIINADTGTSATTATAFNLDIGQTYSFRVSPITVHGMNASGNIWNGSTIQTFVIGDIGNLDVENDNDFSIYFERTDINSTSVQLEVIYPNSYDLSCDFDYKYARTNHTYSGLSTIANGSDNQLATFTLINATGDLVQIRCWDTLTGDESTYVIVITDFPFLQQVNNLRNGEYGTFFQIGAFDGVMMIVIFLGMIGLNKTTPIVGIVFVVITTVALSYFGFITYPEIMYPALIMMIVWAYISTRKDD